MISVVCCTSGTRSSLGQMLDSLGRCRSSLEEIQLVIVENSDSRSLSLEKLGHPDYRWHLTLVHEPRSGLGHARNAGVRAALGGLIAFLDDDVIVRPTWLAGLSAAAKSFPQAGGFGGPVVAYWPGAKPDWFTQQGSSRMHGGGSITSHSLGTRARPYSNRDQPPIGCNMAFRRQVFRDVGLFRPELGMSGDRLVYGDDTDLCRRVRASGRSLRYVPDMRVVHPVRVHKISRAYFRRSYFALGRYLGREQILGQRSRERANRFGQLRCVISAVNRSAQLALDAATLPRGSSRFGHECEILLEVGRIFGLADSRRLGPIDHLHT